MQSTQALPSDRDARWRRQASRVVLPAALAVLVFGITFFVVFLPFFRSSLLEHEKENLRQLTEVAWGVVASYEGLEREGFLSRQAAQEGAIRELRQLRYGPNGLSYYWINDMRPVMIMHPYRPDLENTDLSTYRDPNGETIFLTMSRLVSEGGGGFIPYSWQWQNEPQRTEAKVSYVKGFKPWGWVIGTGTYLRDIDLEVRTLRQKFVLVASLGLFLVSCLSFYMVRRGFREAKMRIEMEEELSRHRLHLEELVEQRTAELEEALTTVKRLSGLLPICASCKKIKDDRGSWQQMEVFIRDRSEATFSHGICPECAKSLYGDFYKGSAADDRG